ncbi:MAG: hypothetical protein K2K56_01025 [Lachnospiraceae bacterium]|nr:hypothetical protein [Lachnospiraceae bacterium]
MLNIAFVGVAILVIIGLALLFHILVKVTPEESWASAVMTVLVLIYVMGLCGDTRPALILIYILAIIGIVVSAVAWIRQSERSLKTFFSTVIVMMFCILGL